MFQIEKAKAEMNVGDATTSMVRISGAALLNALELGKNKNVRIVTRRCSRGMCRFV
jgi:hypothetical protein